MQASTVEQGNDSEEEKGRADYRKGSLTWQKLRREQQKSNIEEMYGEERRERENVYEALRFARTRYSKMSEIEAKYRRQSQRPLGPRL